MKEKKIAKKVSSKKRAKLRGGAVVRLSRSITNALTQPGGTTTTDPTGDPSKDAGFVGKSDPTPVIKPVEVM